MAHELVERTMLQQTLFSHFAQPCNPFMELRFSFRCHDQLVTSIIRLYLDAIVVFILFHRVFRDDDLRCGDVDLTKPSIQ